MTKREKKLLHAIEWALGVRGEFRPKDHLDGAYYWRWELSHRAGLVWNGRKYAEIPTKKARSK